MDRCSTCVPDWKPAVAGKIMLEIIILTVLAVWLVLAVRKIYKDKKAGVCTGCGECSRCGDCTDASCMENKKSNTGTEKEE